MVGFKVEHQYIIWVTLTLSSYYYHVFIQQARWVVGARCRLGSEGLEFPQRMVSKVHDYRAVEPSFILASSSENENSVNC